MTAWAEELGAALDAVHGGPGPGGTPKGVVDFSVNVNPFGPAPTVAEAWIRADAAAYPDPGSVAPRRAAARLWGVQPECVRFAGGATELLHDAALAWLAPGDVGVVPRPAFAEYARAVTLARGRVLHVPPADSDGSLDLGATARAARDHRARMVFLGRPNSPTAEVVDVDDLRAFAAGLPAECLLVLDESFLSFHAGTVAVPPALGVREGVLSVRSVTKDCGLAGLRAGFAVGPVRVTSLLDRVARPWSASAPAQAAAQASFEPPAVAYLDLTLRRLRTEVAAFVEALSARGRRPRHTSVNFVAVRAPDVEDVADTLQARGLRVRRCASFGLPGHLRLGVRRPAENRRLVEALLALPLAQASRRSLAPCGPRDGEGEAR